MYAICCSVPPSLSIAGHDCYSISLRGTSATGMPPADPGESVTIAQHKQDVSFVLDSILDRYKEQSMVVQLPVLVGHSVGGMIVMKMLEDKSIRNKISGNLAIHSARVSLASPR